MLNGSAEPLEQSSFAACSSRVGKYCFFYAVLSGLAAQSHDQGFFFSFFLFRLSWLACWWHLQYIRYNLHAPANKPVQGSHSWTHCYCCFFMNLYWSHLLYVHIGSTASPIPHFCFSIPALCKPADTDTDIWFCYQANSLQASIVKENYTSGARWWHGLSWFSVFVSVNIWHKICQWIGSQDSRFKINGFNCKQVDSYSVTQCWASKFLISM